MVLTKSDLVRPPELARRVASTASWLLPRPGAHGSLLVTSTKNPLSLHALRLELAALVHVPSTAGTMSGLSE